ncbi:MAG: radical SAM protein [Ruminococcus sp.]|nr:radical SAM protein [Ruminococcus sp.]
MISLLSAAKEFIDKFKGIRISTRPDCIDTEVLKILKDFGVTSIELGAQSMDDRVLLLNNRGHNSESVRKASKLIKASGFSLGLQMMTGLYGSSDESDIFTAQEFIKLKCDTVRIYPTVLLKNTYLEELFYCGEYEPQSVEAAVNICSKLIPMFEQADVSVIRVGLHSSDTLEENIVAGAYHPAFRELCENKIYLNYILDLIKTDNFRKGRINVFVSPSSLSKAIGQNKTNFNVLLNLGYEPKFIEDSKLMNRQIYLQEG